MAPTPPTVAVTVRGLIFPAAFTPLQRITLFLTRHGTNPAYNGFDKALIRHVLAPVRASPDSSTIDLTVTPALADREGNLHFGAMVLLFDVCTTTAVIPCAREGFWQGLGVTRSLNVTNIRPAAVGARLQVVSTVVAAEGGLATIRGVVKDRDTGEVVGLVEHLKVDTGPVPAVAKL